MKTTTHTPEQIIKIIEQAEKDDQTIAAICREHAIAENTLYRWRKAYGGMSVNEVQRLKELEKENGRVKRLLAECVLEIDLLKTLLSKKGLTVAQKREAVIFLVAGGLSVPRATTLAQLPHSTFRYVAQPRATRCCWNRFVN